MLINMATATGPSSHVKEKALKAWTAAPDSVAVAHQTLRALQPKWHGSLDQIENVIARLRQRHGRDSRFQWLFGYASYVRAEIASNKDQEEKALGWMKKSLEFGAS